jgi:hypothetical protein
LVCLGPLLFRVLLLFLSAICGWGYRGRERERD